MPRGESPPPTEGEQPGDGEDISKCQDGELIRAQRQME